MKYSVDGFRPLYHNFCIFPINKTIKQAAQEFPGIEGADGVLTYGYMDRECGFTLDLLCCVKRRNEHQVSFAPEPEKIRSILRIGAVVDENFEFFNYGDSDIKDDFAEKLEMIKTYDANEEVETSRTFDFLDEFRHEHFLDDVLVMTVKEGLQPEGCWARIIGLQDKCIIGTLLNEPNQDFGYHEGDAIAFFLYEDGEGNRHLVSDMNASMKITEEDLADGSMLKEAIIRFNEERNQDNFIVVLEILRDSYVWIPCNAILSEEDQKQIEKMIEGNEDNPESLVGDIFTSKDQIRLVPDIFQNGEAFFFPVFSSDEEMGEYGNNFSKVQKHFLEAIGMARANDQDLQGIVINAFSEPMVIDAEIFDIIENMKSRL